MTENVNVWLTFAGAVAVLGVGMWKNRSDIRGLTNAVFGHEREGNGGHEEDIDSLADRLDRIETKIDNEREHRIHDHHNVESEILTNRYLITRSIAELVQEINREAEDLELEVPDIDPPDGFDATRYESSDD